jgi:hypothetical protein
VQPSSLFVVELVATHDHELHLCPVRQVRWLVESESTVLDAGFQCGHAVMIPRFALLRRPVVATTRVAFRRSTPAPELEQQPIAFDVFESLHELAPSERRNESTSVVREKPGDEHSPADGEPIGEGVAVT